MAGIKIVLILTSPLQLFLANMICQQKYPSADITCHFVVGREDVRQKNLITLAKRYGYKYQIQYIEDYVNIQKIKLLLLSLTRSRRFDIAIIGYYVDPLSHMIAYSLLKRNAEIVYCDDGTLTFEISNKIKLKKRMSTSIWKFTRFLLRFKAIRNNIYYTIFDGIESDEYQFVKVNISQNNIVTNPQYGFYLLGTYPEMYITQFLPQMSMEEFNSFMERCVNYIRDKYPEMPLYFTPHGRDRSAFIQDLCIEKQIKYLASNVSVEIDYIDNNYNPVVIAGFSSTALFTLKKIFPHAIVLDFRPENIQYEDCETNGELLKMFEQNKIKTIYL